MVYFFLGYFHCVAHLYLLWYLPECALMSQKFLFLCSSIETVTRIKSWRKNSGKWWSVMKRMFFRHTKPTYSSLPSRLVVTKLEREANGKLSDLRIRFEIRMDLKYSQLYSNKWRMVFIHDRLSAWPRIYFLMWSWKLEPSSPFLSARESSIMSQIRSSPGSPFEDSCMHTLIWTARGQGQQNHL